VASAGRTEEQLKAAGIAYKKAIVPMGVAGGSSSRTRRAPAFVKVLAGAKYGEILGVHAMGDSSSEWIVTAAALIEMQLSARHAGCRGRLPAPDGVRSVAGSNPPLGRSQDTMTKAACHRTGEGFSRDVVHPSDIPVNAYQKTIAEESSRPLHDGGLPGHLAGHVRHPGIREHPQRDQAQGQLPGRRPTTTPARPSVHGAGGRRRGHGLRADPDDHIFGSHRSHGEILAKAFSAIRALSDDELW
jgi:hypothetical protein